MNPNSLRITMECWDLDTPYEAARKVINRPWWVKFLYINSVALNHGSELLENYSRALMYVPEFLKNYNGMLGF